MYCTYCHKEVNSPHRCEETVHRTAHLDYESRLPTANKHKGYKEAAYKCCYMAGPAETEKY